jgi:hypothetical protein
VVTVAGAAALLGGCKDKAETMTHNPPMPDPTPTICPNPPAGPPTWDGLPSTHQGTNPPSPVLVITSDGRCFKKWEGGMTKAGPNRVEAACAGSTCGTFIQCPEGARALLEGKPAEIGEDRAITIARASLKEKAPEGAKPEVTLWGNRYAVSFAPGAPVFVDAITGKVLTPPF